MRQRSALSAAIAVILVLSGTVLLTGNQRAKPENRVLDPGTTFSIAVFPDTQIYPMYYPDTYINMTEWVVEHRDEYNIQFVLHEGDITNNNIIRQWYNASKAMYILNGSVPYTLNPGNHDLGPNGRTANRDTYLNDYFPSGPIENWTSWGGAFEEGHQENTYHYFSAGGRDWMVVALEFAPRDAVLEWANDIVEANPDRLVLVVTHNYMVADQRMTTLGGDYAVEDSPEEANNGEQIWQKFVKLHRNIMCVFSGHILYEWGWLVSNGVNGNPVYQMMTNFQMNTGGGQGFFRLLTFNMEAETAYVETYSPLLDQLKTENVHQFTFDFNAFDHVNDPPSVMNPLSTFSMEEDQGPAYIDLDGNQRPGTGLFFDPNLDQGDSLKYDIMKEGSWVWVGLGTPLQLNDTIMTLMPNGTLKVESSENWFGAFDLVVRARDKRGGEVNTSFNVDIHPVNDPPAMLPPDMWTYDDPEPDVRGDIITGSEDLALHFWVKGEDVTEPEDPITYTMSTDEEELFTFDNDTGEFGFLPLNEDVGNHVITFGVFDGTDMTTREVLIKIINTNDDPRITTGTMNISYENELYSFQFRAVDEDPTDDILTWGMTSDAPFLDIDRRTGIVSGTPGDDDVGSYNVTVKVTDGNDGEDLREYVLEVRNTNDPPYIMRSPSTLFMDEDTVVYFDLSGWFGDIDNDLLSYDVPVYWDVEAEVMENSTIRLEPPGNWFGSTNITVSASDGNESVMDKLRIVVDNVNDPPSDPGYRIESEDRTDNGKLFHVYGWASDPDIDDQLTVDWFSNITGKLGSGGEVELLLQPGHHLITMKVTDRAGEWTQLNFELVVPSLNGTLDQNDDDDIDTSDKESSGGWAVVLMIIVAIVLAVILALAVVIVLTRKRGIEQEPEQ